MHAVRRMSERGFGPDDVWSVIRDGTTVESYPGDTPYPSRLFLGWLGPKPVHGVVADDAKAGEQDLEEAETARLLEAADGAARAGIRVEVREYEAA